jgi:carbonic anhydrase
MNNLGAATRGAARRRLGTKAMRDVANLRAGFRAFRASYFEQRPRLFETLARGGQRPQALIVACSDSRVDPAILFNAEPGELFVVRNVANLVPPYRPDERHHGTSAALEFAVRDLRVRSIVVLGHSACGGIHALCESIRGRPLDREFISAWISIADRACRPHVERAPAGEDPGDNRRAEQAAIAQSVDNLRTFPWIAEGEQAGDVALHGWWFDMTAGALWALERDSRRFAAIEPSA